MSDFQIGKLEETVSDKIAKRIADELGVDLTELLAENLNGSDLHSLLLAVLKRRVSKLDSAVLRQSSAVSRACSLDGRLLNKLESIAFELASDFEVIDLSPLNALGSVSILTGLDQGNVLSTIRPFECAADPTIGLAIESAQRRKRQNDRKTPVRLCSSQRVLRFPLPTNREYSAHFKLFAMLTAGRDSGSFGFELAALKEQIDTYLRLLSELSKNGFAFDEIRVELSDTRAVSHLCTMYGVSRDEIKLSVRARDSSSAAKLLGQHENIWPEKMANPAIELAAYGLPNHLILHLNSLVQKVCAPLSAEHGTVRFDFNMHRLTGLGYYSGPCFHIKARNAEGQSFTIADGGMLDWTQKLLCDSKERLLSSAIGIEMLCRMFR